MVSVLYSVTSTACEVRRKYSEFSFPTCAKAASSTFAMSCAAESNPVYSFNSDVSLRVAIERFVYFGVATDAK